MATDKDLPQIEVEAAAADKEPSCDEKEDESHSSINYVSYSSTFTLIWGRSLSVAINFN